MSVDIRNLFCRYSLLTKRYGNHDPDVLFKSYSNANIFLSIIKHGRWSRD